MASVEVIGRIEADADQGGWKASGAVIGDADRLKFYQSIKIWYDLYLSSGWQGRPYLAFEGHLLPDTFDKTFQSSDAPWAAFTAQGFLKQGKIQGIYFRDVASPANQHQMTTLTYAHIVEHLVGKIGEYGHCNLRRGVWPEGIIGLNVNKTSSTEVAEYEIKEGNFWDRLREMAEIDFYWLYVDKTNTLNFVPHPMFGTLPTPTLTLTSGLLLEPLRITRRNAEHVGQIKLEGQTPAGLQIRGKYPAAPTAGPVVVKNGYLGTSNSLMNAIAQRIYRFENRSHTVEAKLPGAVGLLLELLDRVAITYNSAADGISWSSKKFWVHKIVVEPLKNFGAQTILTLEAEN